MAIKRKLFVVTVFTYRLLLFLFSVLKRRNQLTSLLVYSQWNRLIKTMTARQSSIDYARHIDHVPSSIFVLACGVGVEDWALQSFLSVLSDRFFLDDPSLGNHLSDRSFPLERAGGLLWACPSASCDSYPHPAVDRMTNTNENFTFPTIQKKLDLQNTFGMLGEQNENKHAFEIWVILLKTEDFFVSPEVVRIMVLHYCWNICLNLATKNLFDFCLSVWQRKSWWKD